MKKLIKILWNRGVVAIGGGVVIILSIVDYSQKLGIFKFLWDFMDYVFIFALRHWIYLVLIVIIAWIVLLSTKLRRINMGKTQLVPEEKLIKLEKDLEIIRNNAIKNNINQSSEITRISSRVKKLEDENYDIKRESIKIKIERHEKKGENGAILCRIELLELDMTKGWDFMIHETLGDILSYVKNNSLLSQSAADLKKQLSKLSPEFDPIRSKIESEIKI